MTSGLRKDFVDPRMLEGNSQAEMNDKKRNLLRRVTT